MALLEKDIAKLVSILFVLSLVVFVTIFPGCSATTSTSGSGPAAPTNVMASASSTVSRQITISWTENSEAASYNIYFATTDGVTTTNGTKISGVTGSSYNHTGLTAGATYYYIVTSVGASTSTAGVSPLQAGAEGTPSAQVSATAEYIWNAALVDLDNQDNHGEGNSITVDSNGTPHVAYFDVSIPKVKYGTKNSSGAWVVENVDTNGGGTATAIQVTSNGAKKIAYDRDNQLYVADRSGSTWVPASIAGANNLGSSLALAFDANGFIHASYFRGNAVRYGTNASGSWVETNVEENAAMISSETDIEIDSNGKAHIVYQFDRATGDDNDTLKYANNIASASFENPETIYSVSGFNVGDGPSITLDSEGNPHVAYYHTFTDLDGAIEYAKRTNGSWSRELIESLQLNGSKTAIDVSANGNAFIVYTGRGATNDTQILKFATGTITSMRKFSVAQNGSTGLSISLDGNGIPHIVRYDIPQITYYTEQE